MSQKRRWSKTNWPEPGRTGLAGAALLALVSLASCTPSGPAAREGRTSAAGIRPSASVASVPLPSVVDETAWTTSWTPGVVPPESVVAPPDAADVRIGERAESAVRWSPQGP